MEAKNIYEKLSIVKSEIGVLSKNAKNPFFKSSYLDLNGILSALEPLLENNGLLLLQPIEDGRVVTYIYDAQSPESFIESSMPLPNIVDPQKLGSAITYFRRYTLQSLLALQAIDDDGQLAVKTIENQLPIINSIHFDKYIKCIQDATKDKKGELITIEYLKARHTLNSAQESALQLINL